MFRRWLSTFWRNNKEKITQLTKLFGLLILISVVAAIVFNSLSPNVNNQDNNETKIYNPDKTIISGSDVSKEEYKKDDNLVETFVTYCNEQKIKEAYDLLSDECKEKEYSTIEKFKTNYCDKIFTENREYNLQSWVNNANSVTYKVTFIEDILSSGNYDDVTKMEDYITIVTKNNEKKLNINGYIKTNTLDKVTKVEGLEINIKKEDIYMNYVSYELAVTNLNNNKMLLDMQKGDNIKLIGTNEVEYGLDDTNLFSSNLTIYENDRNKKIELKFKKQYGSGVESKAIVFKRVVTDYEKYYTDKINYKDYKTITCYR